MALAMELMNQCYEREFLKHCKVYPGVAETLAQCRRQGVAIACVTNKPGQFTERLLQRCRLDSFFHTIVSGDTVERKKPSPLPLQFACEQMGVPASQSVMIGDSITDAQAAAALSIPFIAVSYGYHHRTGLARLNADHCVDRFRDILEVLQ